MAFIADFDLWPLYSNCRRFSTTCIVGLSFAFLAQQSCRHLSLLTIHTPTESTHAPWQVTVLGATAGLAGLFFAFLAQQPCTHQSVWHNVSSTSV